MRSGVVDRKLAAAAKWSIAAGLAFIFPALLKAGPPACPNTVADMAIFPGAANNGYVCSETDNVWYDFEDLSTLSMSTYTALPADTYFHIDQIVPYQIAITLEPGGMAQFAGGQTYSWTFTVAEDSLSNLPIYSINSDYGSEFGDGTLTTTVQGLTITGYNADGSAITSPIGQIADFTNTNGANITVGFAAPVYALQITDVLTVASNETLQSVSNSIEETPEPGSVVLMGLATVFLGSFFRRRLTGA